MNHGHHHNSEFLLKLSRPKDYIKIILVKTARQSERLIWFFYSDYGNEDEVADGDVDIREPEKEDESNIKSELEGRRELFRALEKLGFNT